MKKVTMHLYESPFRRIQSGEKKIECRLYDEKRQKLAVGDVIEFILLPEKAEKLERNIVGLYRFSTFEELFGQFPQERGDGNMRPYYSEVEEEKYGVLAIELG